MEDRHGNGRRRAAIICRITAHRRWDAEELVGARGVAWSWKPEAGVRTSFDMALPTDATDCQAVLPGYAYRPLRACRTHMDEVHQASDQGRQTVADLGLVGGAVNLLGKQALNGKTRIALWSYVSHFAMYMQ